MNFLPSDAAMEAPLVLFGLKSPFSWSDIMLMKPVLQFDSVTRLRISSVANLSRSASDGSLHD